MRRSVARQEPIKVVGEIGRVGEVACDHMTLEYNQSGYIRSNALYEE